MAFSRYTRSVLDRSERSETVGTTHAASISAAAGDMKTDDGNTSSDVLRKAWVSISNNTQVMRKEIGSLVGEDTH